MGVIIKLFKNKFLVKPLEVLLTQNMKETFMSFGGF